MRTGNKQGFSLMELVVLNCVSLLFTATLIPATTTARRNAEMVEVGARGKDIFVAIVGANTEREPLGLGDVWPKAQLQEEPEGWGKRRVNAEDITSKTFQSSTSYFYALLDGANIGDPQRWAPYVPGLDYSKLAGAGVPAKVGVGELRPDNNMWCIAGNIREEMEDVIPVLITRNVDCASLYKDYDGKAQTPLRWSQKYSTPFSNEGFVMVRKGGAVVRITAEYAVAHIVYMGQLGGSFKTTAEGHAPLVYLTPDNIAYPQ